MTSSRMPDMLYQVRRLASGFWSLASSGTLTAIEDQKGEERYR